MLAVQLSRSVFSRKLLGATYRIVSRSLLLKGASQSHGCELHRGAGDARLSDSSTVDGAGDISTPYFVHAVCGGLPKPKIETLHCPKGPRIPPSNGERPSRNAGRGLGDGCLERSSFSRRCVYCASGGQGVFMVLLQSGETEIIRQGSWYEEVPNGAANGRGVGRRTR